MVLEPSLGADADGFAHLLLVVAYRNQSSVPPRIAGLRHIGPSISTFLDLPAMNRAVGAVSILMLYCLPHSNIALKQRPGVSMG
jgi:hypothetical protein